MMEPSLFPKDSKESRSVGTAQQDWKRLSYRLYWYPSERCVSSAIHLEAACSVSSIPNTAFLWMCWQSTVLAQRQMGLESLLKSMFRTDKLWEVLSLQKRDMRRKQS